MKRVSNIVFDFDGTLADTAPLIVATMQSAVAELGLEPREDAVLRATIGLRLEDVPQVLWPGMGVNSKLFAATYRKIFDERKSSMKIVCFPGVADTLRRLKDAGVAMAIATSRSRRSLEEYLERLALADCFSYIIGGDDVSRGKPDPEPVEKILNALGWKADETLTVGDAPVDIAMGRAAATQTCAVTYGNATAESLLASRPDHMIDSFETLTEIVAGVDGPIVEYVEREILPRYGQFDRAHRGDHARMVINQSLAIARHMPELDLNMIYCIAAFHDLGLVNGRERHHIDSGLILAADPFICSRFSTDEIKTMKEAVEDHRASGRDTPRSDYGMVVADADRFIDGETIVRRTIQYGLANYPELDREGHYRRTLEHLREKYGPDGYLKLHLPWGDNHTRLLRLHQLIADTDRLRNLFLRLFDEEIGRTPKAVP